MNEVENGWMSKGVNKSTETWLTNNELTKQPYTEPNGWRSEINEQPLLISCFVYTFDTSIDRNFFVTYSIPNLLPVS